MLDKQLLSEFKEVTAKLPGTLTYATAEADALANALPLLASSLCPMGKATSK